MGGKSVVEGEGGQHRAKEPMLSFLIHQDWVPRRLNLSTARRATMRTSPIPST